MPKNRSMYSRPDARREPMRQSRRKRWTSRVPRQRTAGIHRIRRKRTTADRIRERGPCVIYLLFPGRIGPTLEWKKRTHNGEERDKKGTSRKSPGKHSRAPNIGPSDGHLLGRIKWERGRKRGGLCQKKTTSPKPIMKRQRMSIDGS